MGIGEAPSPIVTDALALPVFTSLPGSKAGALLDSVDVGAEAVLATPD